MTTDSYRAHQEALSKHNTDYYMSNINREEQNITKIVTNALDFTFTQAMADMLLKRVKLLIINNLYILGPYTEPTKPTKPLLGKLSSKYTNLLNDYNIKLKNYTEYTDKTEKIKQGLDDIVSGVKKYNDVIKINESPKDHQSTINDVIIPYTNYSLDEAIRDLRPYQYNLPNDISYVVKTVLMNDPTKPNIMFYPKKELSGIIESAFGETDIKLLTQDKINEINEIKRNITLLRQYMEYNAPVYECLSSSSGGKKLHTRKHRVRNTKHKRRSSKRGSSTKKRVQ